jgi:hypothetical protein
MKKIAYLSILILSLALVSTSCCKDEDELIPDPTTSIYAGVWNTQAVYDVTNASKEIDPNYVVFKFINNGKATVGNREYPSWSVSGNTIALAAGDYPAKIITVLVAPTTTSNYMKLQLDVAGETLKFEVAK